MLRLVGKDTGRRFVSTFAGHYRVMDDGRIVTEAHFESKDCKV